MHSLYFYRPSSIRRVYFNICTIIAYPSLALHSLVRPEGYPNFRRDVRIKFLLGFSATPANLLTVPVYVFACIVTCGVGFFADRWGRRGYFNL